MIKLNKVSVLLYFGLFQIFSSYAVGEETESTTTILLKEIDSGRDEVIYNSDKEVEYRINNKSTDLEALDEDFRRREAERKKLIEPSIKESPDKSIVVEEELGINADRAKPARGKDLDLPLYLQESPETKDELDKIQKKPTSKNGKKLNGSTKEDVEKIEIIEAYEADTSKEGSRKATESLPSIRNDDATITREYIKTPQTQREVIEKEDRLEIIDQEISDISDLEEEYIKNLKDLPKLPEGEESEYSVETKEDIPMNFPKALPFIQSAQGPNSLRHERSIPKNRTVTEISAGGGPNETLLLQTSMQVRIYDHLLGLAYERAQWLDVETNTGKLTESYYADYCAPFSFDGDSTSIIPCFRYGEGNGTYKERNERNEIVTKEQERRVFKLYGRGILKLFDGKRAGEGTYLEITAGYSQDPFLYGGYTQVWLKTAIPFTSVGFEVYDQQRVAISLSLSFGI